MKAYEEAAFREYVGVAMQRLRRSDFVYCRDWHTADDLVGTTLVKLDQYWHRAQQATNLDAYVFGILAHAWLDEKRRPWRREQAVPELASGALREAAASRVRPATPRGRRARDRRRRRARWRAPG